MLNQPSQSQKNIDFLKKATGLPRGRNLEGNGSQLQCKKGQFGREEVVFSGSCLFKRILFCWQKM